MSIRPRRSLLNPKLTRPNALESQPRDRGLLWLDKNENLDPELNGLAHRILNDIEPVHIASYPELSELYRKTAKWVGVSPEALLITPGSDGAIRMVFEAFVEHGDSVIYPNPTFAMYQVYAQMFGARESIVQYQYSENGPALNVEQLKELLRLEKPKIFCLPNPDSPTGTVLSQNDLKDLLTICEEVGAVFLLDEAYYPFFEWSGVHWTQRSRNLIIARTFAKAWGAAGMRIGYLVGHPDTISLIHKMRPMYELGTVSIEFMVRMLDHIDVMQSSVDKINEGKIYFATEMSSLGFKVLATEGNFVHVAFGVAGSLVSKALANKVLYRQSFNHPSLEGISRFTIAPKEKMECVVELIKRALDY